MQLIILITPICPISLLSDMIRIMQEYGSESSNQTLPQQRKNSIKKTSVRTSRC